MVVIGGILAFIFAVVLIHAADWAATKVLWLCVVVLVLVGLGLVGYHRRKMAEIRNERAERFGGYRRVNRALPWPKRCRACGQHIHGWPELTAHSDAETSACAAHLDRIDRAQSAPEPWTVTVTTGTGDGAVDTLTPGKSAPELEE